MAYTNPDSFDNKKEGIFTKDGYYVPYEHVDFRIPDCELILDFGSGTGRDTKKYLLPMVQAVNPDVRIIGLDISSEMVEFAQKHNSDPNITYEQGDILGDDLSRLDGQLSQIVSRYVLDYIPDWRTVLKIFHRMLKPKGQLAVITLTTPKWFQITRKLMNHPTLGPYMKELVVQDWVDSDLDSAEELHKEALEEIGFSVSAIKTVAVHFKEDEYQANVDFFVAANPFAASVPAHLLGDLRSFHEEEMRSLNRPSGTSDAADDTVYEYHYVHFIASKD